MTRENSADSQEYFNHILASLSSPNVRVIKECMAWKKRSPCLEIQIIVTLN